MKKKEEREKEDGGHSRGRGTYQGNQKLLQELPQRLSRPA